MSLQKAPKNDAFRKPPADAFEALTDAVGRPMRREKAMTRKAVVMTHATVTLDAYALVARAVSEGVAYGIQRAHKHCAAPAREVIAENVEREVMNALCEVMKF